MANLGKAATPSFQMPEFTDLQLTFGNFNTINTANERNAIIGRVLWEDGGTHNIAEVGIYYGTNTAFSGGTTYRVSLQDVDTSGAQGIPDGTADQSVTYTTAPTSNAWTSHVLTSARSSVANGTLLAVVMDFTVYSAGAVAPRTQSIYVGSLRNATSYCLSTADGTTWNSASYSSVNPVIGFKSDDATPVYGTFMGCWPVSAFGNIVFNTGTDPKEVMLEFTPDISGKVSALCAHVDPAGTSSDFDLVLTNSADAALATASVDQTLAVDQSIRLYQEPIALTQIDAGSLYRIAVKPTSANNVTINYFDVPEAGYLNVISCGAGFVYNTRAASGAVGTAVTTRRPIIHAYMSQVDTGGGGGGDLGNIMQCDFIKGVILP